MAEGKRAVDSRLLWRAGESGALLEARDEVAVEEPLEIRVAGETLAVVMRTPGEDHALVMGFLLAEGVIARRDDVSRVFHCGRPGDEAFGNSIDVAPGPGVALDPALLAERRGTLSSSACGVCGRRSIADLLERCPSLPEHAPLPLALLAASTSALPARQPHFARTGGLHAAALLDALGRVQAISEDVGRHNAVDKAIGTLVLADRLPRRATAPGDSVPCVLAVSGRVSFEIVQKAVVAGIPVVCSVSAPTSLAIDLAERSGLTLAAFVRDGRLNLYTHKERIAAPT